MQNTFKHKLGGGRAVPLSLTCPLHPNSQSSLLSKSLLPISAAIKASCVSAALFFCFAPILSSALSSTPFSGWVGGCSLQSYPVY